MNSRTSFHFTGVVYDIFSDEDILSWQSAKRSVQQPTYLLLKCELLQTIKGHHKVVTDSLTLQQCVEIIQRKNRHN